jgi:dTDP-4-amino-4,6-dideoxygalactose transaminase
VIRLTRPYFTDGESAAVAEVLASGMLIQGQRVAAFEAATADFLGGLARTAPPHCLAVATGTAALELSLASVPRRDGTSGVTPRDEVIVPAVSWPSPGHAVILEGATPVLADVDLDTWCLDVTAATEVATPRTASIIAIDQFGVPAPIPALRRAIPGVDVVEDSACALGSTLDGVPCGLLGDVGIYSYHPRKVITTGEGGMCVTRDDARADLLRALRNHGQSTPGTFRCAGPNQRLSELHAAVGVVQMTKLEDILRRRRAMAAEVRAAVDLRWQRAPQGAEANHQTLGFVLPRPATGDREAARNALLAALRESGVEASILSYALHRLPQFAAYAVNRGRRFPVADAVVDGGVAVPLHPGMSGEDVGKVVDALRAHAAWAIGKAVAL